MKRGNNYLVYHLKSFLIYQVCKSKSQKETISPPLSDSLRNKEGVFTHEGFGGYFLLYFPFLDTC